MMVHQYAFGSRLGDRSSPVGQAEAVDRFCRTCVRFHETRVRFLPDEAPDFVPPGCYYRGNGKPAGWCNGVQYEEGLP
jgi:hypothetical protein